MVVVGHKAAQSLEGLVLLENNHLNFRWSIDLKGKEMEQQGFFKAYLSGYPLRASEIHYLVSC